MERFENHGNSSMIRDHTPMDNLRIGKFKDSKHSHYRLTTFSISDPSITNHPQNLEFTSVNSLHSLKVAWISQEGALFGVDGAWYKKAFGV